MRRNSWTAIWRKPSMIKLPVFLSVLLHDTADVCVSVTYSWALLRVSVSVLRKTYFDGVQLSISHEQRHKSLWVCIPKGCLLWCRGALRPGTDWRDRGWYILKPGSK
ncbi:hypothetical protein C8Q74DRAFT_531386 [Fomes fomentarius]|nr:hypothetical protein C8Q74DRAFT_531386 [Fomes fomentarius]